MSSLSCKKTCIHEGKAFQTILKNRTFHGGILAAGSGFVKKGKSGEDILSRWYPSTLAKRLRNIEQVVSKLQFEQGDAFDAIARHKDKPPSSVFYRPSVYTGRKESGQSFVYSF